MPFCKSLNAITASVSFFDISAEFLSFKELELVSTMSILLFFIVAFEMT